MSAKASSSRGVWVVSNPETRSGRSRGYLHNALKSLRDFGADEGIRTLDPNPGKVALIGGAGRSAPNDRAQRPPTARQNAFRYGSRVVASQEKALGRRQPTP